MRATARTFPGSSSSATSAACADRERRLAELAAKDELTGLLNKRSFLVNLAGEVARARRHSRSLSLAILDLDGFKRVNDAGGHPAGDRVLAEAAGRLGALVRTGEHLARVGGDEFGWILPDADAEGASSAVNRACDVIGGEEFRGAGALTPVGGDLRHRRHDRRRRGLPPRRPRALQGQGAPAATRSSSSRPTSRSGSRQHGGHRGGLDAQGANVGVAPWAGHRDLHQLRLLPRREHRLAHDPPQPDQGPGAPPPAARAPADGRDRPSARSAGPSRRR